MQPSPLHPLQTQGRFRDAHIERQATSLLNSNPREQWRQVAVTNREAEEWVQEEALVCLLRTYQRRGETDNAWRLAEVLLQRTVPFLNRHISVWHLPPHYVEECIRDTQEQLLNDMFNLSAKAEFWEIRFWLCLKRRLLNVIQHYKRITEAEFHPTDTLEDGEQGEDSISRIPDSKSLPLANRALIADALAQLKEQERIAFTLFHSEDWGQQEIAERLGVSERTVRNLLTRAEKRLAEWRTMAN